MRFRHKDAAPVIAYLRDHPCAIDLLKWDHEQRQGALPMPPKPRKPEPAKRVGISDVEFIAGTGRSASHAAIVVSYYFHINSTAGPRPLTLIEAVEFVEAQAARDEFLLSGHPDGGLISVSHEVLPFQQGLTPITWWGP